MHALINARRCLLCPGVIAYRLRADRFGDQSGVRAHASGSAAVTARAVARAVDIAPTIEAIQAAGATSLRAIATALKASELAAPALLTTTKQPFLRQLQ
jgi:hypothetical protein